MQARSINAYLDSADSLARLRAHAERLTKLQRVFIDLVAPHLAKSSRVANYRLGKLVIHADSGAVAAKLRQMLPSLRDEFCVRGCEITEIQVKPQPSYTPVRTSGVRPPTCVSQPAKEELSALARELPADSPLRASLERLVRRAR